MTRRSLDQATPTVPDAPASDEQRSDGGSTGRGRAWIRRQRPLSWLIALVALTVVVGSVLRFVTSAHIWLDEALTIDHRP